MVLYHIKSVTIQSDLIYASLMPYILFFTSIPFFFIFYKLKKLSKETFICIVMCCGFGNTSFVGFPLLEAYRGLNSIPIGLVIDQAGTFLCLSTLGLSFLIYSTGKNLKISSIIIRIIKFPAFYCLVIGFLLKPYAYPEFIKESLYKLSITLAPLALFSVGFQFKLGDVKLYKKELFLGLGFKLFLFPLLNFVILYYIFNHTRSDFISIIIILESAMPSMITSSMLAIEYNQNPSLAGVFLGFGIPLGIISTYIWNIYL
jgi:predicted permease